MLRAEKVAILCLLCIGAISCGGQPEEVSRLSYFKGEYLGSSIVGFGASFGTQARPMTVIQPSANEVSFTERYQVQQDTFSSWRGECKMDLRYDEDSNQYLFNFNTAPDPYSIKDMVLSYSDEKGYLGSGTMQIADKQEPVQVSITLDRAQGGHVWEVKTEAQDFRFSFKAKNAAEKKATEKK